MQLFLDCDGMLADFDRGAKRVLGLPPRLREPARPARLLEAAREDGRFLCDLAADPDAMRLFDAVRHLDPIILTGCPRGGWAEAQKERWAATHFPATRIITCMAVDKRRHAQQGDILIDDTLRHRHLSGEAGGTFVHHRDAASTLAELHALGVLARDTLGARAFAPAH